MERVALALVITLVLVAVAIEGAVYRRALRRIGWRIHVNGTRGKSSVVRLIASGLRAAGWRVVAKTTGSAARIILEDGAEAPIARPGRPTIGEQRRFVGWAAARGVDAVIVECMAVRPEYQKASEDCLLRAHVAVITNIRPDHLEVIGPDLDAAARAFAATLPRGGTAVTAEHDRLDILRRAADRRGTRLIAVSPQAGPALAREPFSENVALALEVCRILGAAPEVALGGMRSVRPDPGVLNVFTVAVGDITLTCVNAFAANDPVSARLAAGRALAAQPPGTPLLVLYNHRADRPLRAGQFAGVIADLHPAAVLVTGEVPAQMARWLRARGIRPVMITRTRDPETVMQQAAQQVPSGGIVLGLGNIAGVGMRLVDRWRAAQHA